MRMANVAGRAVLVEEGGLVDVAAASGGRFGPAPSAILDDWEPFVAWAGSAQGPRDGSTAADVTTWGPPVPEPRQVFGIGLNYRDHAAESNLAEPTSPVVFTKFASCLAGLGPASSSRRAAPSTGRPSWWWSSAPAVSGCERTGRGRGWPG